MIFATCTLKIESHKKTGKIKESENKMRKMCLLSDDIWGIKNKIPLVLEELSRNNTLGNWNYPSRTKNNHQHI